MLLQKGSDAGEIAATDARPHRGLPRLRFTQDKTVAAIGASLFVLFAVFLPGFATAENLLDLVRSVSILGILGIGLASASWGAH